MINMGMVVQGWNRGRLGLMANAQGPASYFFKF